MTTADLLPLWVLVPLLAASVAVLMRPRVAAIWSIAVLLVGLAAWPLLAQTLLDEGAQTVALAGLSAPLAIRLHLDGLGLVLIALIGVVMLAASVHALVAPGRFCARPAFWPAWLVLLAGLHAVVLAFDLFNMYVGLELLTLAAVALVASAGSIGSLAAAMRYLLLAMLASLAWLLGVALVYASSGSVDLELAGAALPAGPAAALALALMFGGLLLKAAIFPLHGWLPLAHGQAPGPVSAVLSALVVKASLLLAWRLWLWLGPGSEAASAGVLLAMLGAGAIVYGSLAAFRQLRLKQVVAFSTVAQLGYLLLVLAMPVTAAWQGSVLHLLSHGLAKAAMFLAAANLLRRFGSDELTRLHGADVHAPLSVFAFALAAVSLIGLPPSGGFLAKWNLLLAAWQTETWWLVVVLLGGSLLAAAYLFRVLAVLLTRPEDKAVPTGRAVAPAAEWLPVVLAAAAVALGFFGAPVLELAGLPLEAAP